MCWARSSTCAAILRADDTAHFLDDDGNGTLDSSYGSSYAWLTWNARLGERLEVITLASTSLHEWNRGAEENDAGGFFEVRDTRDLRLAALKQDWQLNWSERLLWRWGGELKGGSADYDYFRMLRRRSVEDNEFITRFDSSTVSAAPEGSELGFYLSQRMRPWKPLTIESGLRWDRQTLPAQSQLSPRFSALLALDARTNLRAAWGRYAQPQALHQLRVVDGESGFSGAEKAEQIVLGAERDLGKGLRARGEVYRRHEWDLQPRYRNLNNTVEPVAEVEGDRVRIDPSRARARGVELMVLRNSGRSSWSASYALARAEDRIDQEWVPRPLDQRHTFYTDYSIAPGANWRVSWAWQYHTGWPSTPTRFVADTVSNGDVIISTVYDPYNSGRFPSYHRMDLRVTRAFALKHGRLSVFLDVFNLYDRNNPQSYEYSVNYSRGSGLLRVNQTIEPLLPRLPTIGATWEF